METFRSFHALVESFFPPLCLHCESRIRPDGVLCGQCELDLDSCRIPSCEMPGITPESREVWGTWYYRLESPIRSMHRALKYEANQRVGALVAGNMQIPNKIILEIPEDAVCIPIPSHRIRVLERGLQQTTILAHGIASQLSVKILLNKLVRRTLSTSQSKLGRANRLANLSNVFSILGRIQFKHVVLVDDVMTTGATLDAAAELFERRGASVTLIVAAFRREAFARGV